MSTWMDKFRKKDEIGAKTVPADPQAVEPRDDSPAKVELSGSVEVNLKSDKPMGEDTNGPAKVASDEETLENHTEENTFKTWRQQESGLDEVRVINVLCYDPANGGRRTNIGDVRRKHGKRLDLGQKHEPWINGVKATDTTEPEAGSKVIWKEDAKGRSDEK